MHNLTDKEKIEILIKAIKQSARTHHLTSRLMPSPGYHASNQHWQYCQASSCSTSFQALLAVGEFGIREIQLKDKFRIKLLKRLKIEV